MGPQRSVGTTSTFLHNRNSIIRRPPASHMHPCKAGVLNVGRDSELPGEFPGVSWLARCC